MQGDGAQAEGEEASGGEQMTRSGWPDPRMSLGPRTYDARPLRARRDDLDARASRRDSVVVCALLRIAPGGPGPAP